MSDTRVSRRRSVRTLGRFSRGASARRVERGVRSCDPGGQVASRVPRGRASSRRREGTEGPQGERKIFARVPELGSLALGLSRAPMARARSRRARHRRAHAVQTTRTRDLRGQRCPTEASRAVAPKRARSSTSSGAPGRAREGAREGGKHRKAGNLPGTRRLGNAAHLPQKNPKLASSRQSRSRQATPLPSRPYAAVSTQARDPSPSPLRALLGVTEGHRRSGASFGEREMPFGVLVFLSLNTHTQLSMRFEGSSCPRPSPSECFSFLQVYASEPMNLRRFFRVATSLKKIYSIADFPFRQSSQ